ncbi:MAG: tRNA-binding protein [Candidatus Heimdallarchaeota archaeon]
MNYIEWTDFTKVKIHVGKILQAEVYEEARKPAYILHVDFGEKLGIKKTSAQITDNYTTNELIDKQVLAVTNFPPKQIGKIMSEVLVLGAVQNDGTVILISPDLNSEIGAQIS